MHPKTASEQTMWSRPVREISCKSTDSAINSKYREGEQRIVTESNREKIPNFVDALSKHGYMNVRPFYQRRKRWNNKQKSRLIESFIMNIPVPPLFVYEKDFNQYEVMDGQQRISALREFYNGEFKLTGLDIWPELNGRTYSKLPAQVRQGLDRRSISYIIVLKESSEDEDSAVFLQQTVFERLNTGGVKLERQEIRNCLFQGKFNELLLELSANPLLREAWGIPLIDAENSDDPTLSQNTTYLKMKDVELVLRFFALRHAEHYARGMQGFLDLYMSRAQHFNDEDLEVLRALFTETIETAHQIFKDLLFKPFSTKRNEWLKAPSAALFDAQMVSIAQHLKTADRLIENGESIRESTKHLFMENEERTFTGQGNTKLDIINRISKFSEMISRFA